MCTEKSLDKYAKISYDIPSSYSFMFFFFFFFLKKKNKEIIAMYTFSSTSKFLFFKNGPVHHKNYVDQNPENAEYSNVGGFCLME